VINDIPNSTIFDDLDFLSDPRIQLLQASARASCFSIRCYDCHVPKTKSVCVLPSALKFGTEENLFEISKAYQLMWPDKPQLAVQQMFCMRKTAKAELE